MDENRKRTTEDGVSARISGTVTLRLDPRDRKAITTGVASQLMVFLEQRFSGVAGTGEGLQVLSASEVARRLGTTERQLRRRESRGDFPKRRQISDRRVAYLWHEIRGVAADLVMVVDDRQLNRDQLAKKLGVARATIERMVKSGDLPPRFDDRHWYERDIDEWLLDRPQVQD